MPTLTTIAFDADDTLWQNEHFYRLTERRFTDLLADYGDAATISHHLLQAEKKNLALYGYGIKGFMLSMIETAIDVSNGAIGTKDLKDILDAGREMLAHPVDMLPQVRETLEHVKGSYRMLLVTKGDLFDQERKIALSGLGDMFDAIEIVSDKNVDTYRRIFARHGDGPERGMMVGNSLKSDIVPAIAAGSWGVYVPHALTWVHEHVDAPTDAPRFVQIDALGGLADLLKRIG
ncbi:MAG TPA: HAD family hydrolase [Tahibacter sp.]|nr:HAD family hydrolase [Tahibacter sp.]